MRPGPLPPLLAALHAALEGHAEVTEEGVLIIEQDRRPVASGPPLLPVIVFVPARPRPGATTGRVAPELIAEVASPASDGRRERYAKAGVREYWRVDSGPAGTSIVIHDGADTAAATWGRVRTFAGTTPIESALFPGLTLRPADLGGGASGR